ncbi:leucine-rich repeat-containing protein 36-like [Pristis pectinata]|uniref:leucine-rich repeat-containing protein 36-like n=1 Tax=Pristis pectinata TaxID=685728 RepID=UPI00223D76D0|nr:leucine-rich repeat-containing protein 36-like [Pristis pectinata]
MCKSPGCCLCRLSARSIVAERVFLLTGASGFSSQPSAAEGAASQFGPNLVVPATGEAVVWASGERPGGDRAAGRTGRGREGRSERGRGFTERKMEAVELVATEEWIRNKAQLSNVRSDEVESLSLQGTYNDKIVALGDALLNFKRLRSLDLSRNSIVNLGGLECLHSLEKLNLYYNNVPSLKEISSLRHLINLKELDIRLNPITRNEENYRQCVIRLLPNLKKLDDRPIRDSERKTAQMHFNSQEQNGTSELDKTEESDHIKKNFTYDKDEQDSMSPTMKYKWDAASNIKTDLKERWASRDLQLMNDHQESACSRPPLSALYSARDVKETRENDVSSKMSLDPMETEHLRSGQYHSYLSEDDYRTYQSPVRSSLRSIGKNVCNRSREGFRVTFSDKILDSCSDEKNCQKNSINSEYDHSSGYSKKERNLMDYTDTSVMKDTSTSIETNSILSRDYHKQPYTDTKSYQSTLESQSSYLNHQTDKATTGMNSDRLFKLNSDLKTSSTYGSSKSTHVDDSTSNHRSRMPSIGLIPHHGTSSSDHIVDRQSLISPSSSFTSLYSVGSKRGFTEHVNTELMANKSSERQSQLTTANMEHFESKLEPKKTSSLSSLLYMQPSYDRKQATLDKLLEVDECGDYRSRTPVGLSSGVSANASSLLQNLLDLVDRHWNGSRSLHTNQRFLNSAHELLSNVLNSMSISKTQSLEKKVKALAEENKSLLTRTGSGLDTAELHRVKHQLTQKQDDLESLKGRLAKVLDENNKLRSQLTSLELANCAGNQLQNKNLQKDNERLNLEVEYLNQQIKQYNKLQETVTMLQESHRALISTNNYLQEQLNIHPAGQKSDMSHHLGSHRTKVWSKLSASGISELPLSSKSSHHSNTDIL